ncbi:MAG: hypothetical protein WD180_01215 [Pseudohongiellaceae bacterium]
MSLRNYLYTCLFASALTIVVLLLVPGAASAAESLLLGFLATYATG